MAVQDLKREVLTKCNAAEIVLALTYQLTKKRKLKLGTIRRQAPMARAKELRDMRDLLDDELKFLSSQVTFKIKLNVLEKYFESALAEPQRCVYIPKWWVDPYLVQDLHRIHPYWKDYPPHAYVAVDFSGQLSDSKKYEHYLPEAALYEDMCLAYNLAVDSQRHPISNSVTNLQIKTHKMALRTSVLAAFYFVEACLNAIAFDFWFLEKDTRTLSQEEADLLLEWDSRRNSEKWRPFREKVLQYPRVILGSQHPPFTETDCPELKLLLGKAKELRDSIVHQSPKLNPGTLQQPKVRAIMELNLSDVTSVVDAAIRFVSKLSERLGKYGQNLRWLNMRDKSGRFPDTAFE